MSIYEYICKTWPNHAQRIIEATYTVDRDGAEYILTRVADTYEPNRVLSHLFIWGCTAEGHEYWKALVDGEACNV